MCRPRYGRGVAMASSCQVASPASSARAALAVSCPFSGRANRTGQDHGSPAPSSGAGSGKSSSTGPSGLSSSASAAAMTRCWNAGSPGAPRGRPRGKGTQSERGGAIASVCSRTRLIPVVDRPSDSRKCESALTARVQFGQTGVRKTESTPSPCRSDASSRALGPYSVGSR